MRLEKQIEENSKNKAEEQKADLCFSGEVQFLFFSFSCLFFLRFVPFDWLFFLVQCGGGLCVSSVFINREDTSVSVAVMHTG